MAGKARVHELAKELGVPSKEVLAKLSELGEFVKHKAEFKALDLQVLAISVDPRERGRFVHEKSRPISQFCLTPSARSWNSTAPARRVSQPRGRKHQHADPGAD